jgi:hypothetical protein
MEEILYMVVERGVYLFMDDLSLYHYTIITIEDRYKITY